MNPAGDKADEDDAPPVPGMLATTPEKAAAAERAEAGRAAAESARDADGPAVLGAARMKELKDKARAEIEQRLKERRKKRRLLRGDASGGFSIS
jgi:hypothetical protein